MMRADAPAQKTTVNNLACPFGTGLEGMGRKSEKERCRLYGKTPLMTRCKMS